MANDPTSDEQASEQAFWAMLIEQLAQSSSGGGSKNNIIMAGRGINCYLDASDDGESNMALYEIADTIPEWGMAYAGGKTGDFYGTYHAWLQQLHPPAGDVNAEAQLKVVQAKIASYDDGIQSIRMANYKNYVASNCLSPSTDGTTCSAWMPGAGSNDWLTEWQTYMAGDEYKSQLDKLTTDFGATMDGLQEQFNTLAQQAYGAGYQTLVEAQSAADLADPNITDRSANQAAQALLAQMVASQSGSSISVPRYTSTPSKGAYREWLANAKQNFAAGAPPALQLQITQSDHETNTSSYQFSGGVCFPCFDIFMGSGSTSGSGTTVNINNYDFTCDVTYQDLLFVACAPSTVWYSDSILSLYSRFTDFPAGSQFASPPAAVCPPFGKDGYLPMRVVGFYVAYRQSVKLSMTNFNEFKKDTQWTEKTSCSLFGLFNVGSESVSKQYSELDVKTLADGFAYTDISEIPKIIALQVQPLGAAQASAR